MFKAIADAYRTVRFNTILEDCAKTIHTRGGRLALVPGLKRWPRHDRFDYRGLARELETKHGLVVLVHCLICNCGNADCETVQDEVQCLAIGTNAPLAWDVYRQTVRAIMRAEIGALTDFNPDFEVRPWVEYNLIEIELLRQQLCERFRIQLNPFVTHEVLAEKVC